MKATTMTLDDYLELPYRISLTPDRGEEGVEGWVAEIDELPGCLSQGSTPEVALAGVRDAMAGWISVALEDGRPIPGPRAELTHSGRFVVRMPRTLHATLAAQAEGEGVSLNQLVVTLLAWGTGARERDRVSV
jgi:antitoxin HicB